MMFVPSCFQATIPFEDFGQKPDQRFGNSIVWTEFIVCKNAFLHMIRRVPELTIQDYRQFNYTVDWENERVIVTAK